MEKGFQEETLMQPGGAREGFLKKAELELEEKRVGPLFDTWNLYYISPLRLCIVLKVWQLLIGGGLNNETE